MRGERQLTRQGNNAYKYENRNQDKENIPLRMNYDQSKKFSYSQCDRRLPPSPQNNVTLSKDEQISRLRQELNDQKKKVKHLETTIIQEQSSVLQHLEMLEQKFQQVTSEKHHLEVQLHKISKDRGRRRDQDSQESRWKERYYQLEGEHKKIKNVANSMIDMMKKVDGSEGDVHQAWKWVKRIVWQYQGIRKKALQWKTVYDQVTEAVDLLPTSSR